MHVCICVYGLLTYQQSMCYLIPIKLVFIQFFSIIQRVKARAIP